MSNLAKRISWKKNCVSLASRFFQLTATWAAEGFTQQMKREPAIQTTATRLIKLAKGFWTSTTLDLRSHLVTEAAQSSIISSYRSMPDSKKSGTRPFFTSQDVSSSLLNKNYPRGNSKVCLSRRDAFPYFTDDWHWLTHSWDPDTPRTNKITRFWVTKVCGLLLCWSHWMKRIFKRRLDSQ